MTNEWMDGPNARNGRGEMEPTDQDAALPPDIETLMARLNTDGAAWRRGHAGSRAPGRAHPRHSFHGVARDCPGIICYFPQRRSSHAGRRQPPSI